MQRKHLLSSVLTLGTCALLTLSVQAADPTGTWTWTAPGRGGGEGRKTTLKLKLDGDKLTGTIATAPAREGATPREIAISDAKLTGNEISFTVAREGGGTRMVQKYTGTISGDTIKGKIEFQTRDGQTRTRDWEAKREK